MKPTTVPIAIQSYSSRLVWVVSVLIPVAFFIAGATRAAPFQDDVNNVRSAGEDWLRYKRNAVSILEDGLSMPVVRGPYQRPGGFLYNYFLAGVFFAFGVNASVAYVVQSLLIGVAASVMFLTFRRYLSPPAEAIFLAGLVATLYVDFFRIYVFRLLSENLLMILLPVAFWLILRSHERRTPAAAAAAGAVVGAAVLTRPNVALFGPAVAALLALYAPRTSSARYLVPAVFCLSMCAVVCLMPLRNYVATGSPAIPVLTYTGDWMTPDRTGARPRAALTVENALATATYYGRRVLFTMGATTVLSPGYSVRPHWLLMWGGFVAFLGIALVRRELNFWQALIVTFIILYLAPLIAVAVINNYGFRMIVPVIPALWLLTVYTGDQLQREFRTTSSAYVA